MDSSVTSLATRPGRNGGRLLAGGKRGHVGAGGRPPSALRERLRGSFEERVKVLEAIADDAAIDPQDRIRAVDVLGKYGLGSLREVSTDEVRERVRATLEVIRRHLPGEQAAPIIADLREVWLR